MLVSWRVSRYFRKENDRRRKEKYISNGFSSIDAILF